MNNSVKNIYYGMLWNLNDGQNIRKYVQINNEIIFYIKERNTYGTKRYCFAMNKSEIHMSMEWNPRKIKRNEYDKTRIVRRI